jgi:hypothetical protein
LLKYAYEKIMTWLMAVIYTEQKILRWDHPEAYTVKEGHARNLSFLQN